MRRPRIAKPKSIKPRVPRTKLPTRMGRGLKMPGLPKMPSVPKMPKM